MRNLLIIINLIILTACSSLSTIAQQPKASVKAVNLESLNMNGGKLNFSLEVDNPNSFPIITKGLDYGLSVNGINLADGLIDKKINLPANGKSLMQVPLSFSTKNIMHMVPQIMRERKVNYKLNGSVHLPFIKLPFSKSGDMGA